MERKFRFKKISDLQQLLPPELASCTDFLAAPPSAAKPEPVWTTTTPASCTPSQVLVKLEPSEVVSNDCSSPIVVQNNTPVRSESCSARKHLFADPPNCKRLLAIENLNESTKRPRAGSPGSLEAADSLESPDQVKSMVSAMTDSFCQLSKAISECDEEMVADFKRNIEISMSTLSALMVGMLEQTPMRTVIDLLPADYRDVYMSAALLRKRLMAKRRALNRSMLAGVERLPMANNSTVDISANDQLASCFSSSPSPVNSQEDEDSVWLNKETYRQQMVTTEDIPLSTLLTSQSPYFPAERVGSPLTCLAEYGSLSPLKLGAHGKFRNFFHDDSDEFCRANFAHSASVQKALKDVFGLKQFRHKQLAAINAAMLNHDCFILMPTGAGKSLCYQLPAVLSAAVTFVVSPLKSLIEDQVQKMQAFQVSAISLSGEVSNTKLDQLKVQLYQKQINIKLVYVTPEKLTASTKLMDIMDNLYERNMLARFVVDEAHCVSQWGHDFRPDYKRMSMLRRRFPNVPIMALTATATPKIVVDTKNQLSMDRSKLFVSSFVRSNLRYKVMEKEKKSSEVIVSLIQGVYRDSSGIIYCLSRKDCDAMASLLRNHGIMADSYHAGQSDCKRLTVQKSWLMGKTRVICATIAFGMGIDKADVRFVIHHSLPKSVEGYYQETGRAGRDGLPAHCVLFYSYQDHIRLRRLIESEVRADSDPSVLDMHRANLLQVVAYAENVGVCRRKMLVEHFGEIYDSAACKADRSSACDVCLAKTVPSLVDVTQDALLILTSLKAMEARGINRVTLRHLADIYRGAQTKETMDRHHLPAYGKGSQLGNKGALRVMHHLVCEEVLVEQLHNNSVDMLVSYVRAGRRAPALLSGNLKIHVHVLTGSRSGDTVTTVSEGQMAMEKNRFKHQDISERCLEALNIWLCQTADREGLSNITAILSAEAVQQIACWLPRTQSELLGVDTVTEGKLKKYGADIMALLEPFWDEVDRRESDRLNRELDLLRRTQPTASSSSTFGSTVSQDVAAAAAPRRGTGFVKASTIGGRAFGRGRKRLPRRGSFKRKRSSQTIGGRGGRRVSASPASMLHYL